jgi:hypothetical protein
MFFRSLLLSVVFLCSFAARAHAQNPDWTTPLPPFKIAGNLLLRRQQRSRFLPHHHDEGDILINSSPAAGKTSSTAPTRRRSSHPPRSIASCTTATRSGSAMLSWSRTSLPAIPEAAPPGLSRWRTAARATTWSSSAAPTRWLQTSEQPEVHQDHLLHPQSPALRYLSGRAWSLLRRASQNRPHECSQAQPIHRPAGL